MRATAICSLVLLAWSWQPATAEEAPAADQSRIAFVCKGDEIWTVGPKGQNPTRVVKTEDAIWAPVWSPDGSRLAFFTVKRRGPAGLMVADVATGTAKPLGKFEPSIAADGIAIEAPVWSQDGDSLLVHDKEGTYRVASSGESTSPVLVAPVPGRELAPEWQQVLGKKEAVGPVPAPADSVFAFGVGKDLVLVGSGREKRVIHAASEPIRWIRWLPGGNRLLYLSGPLPPAPTMPTGDPATDLFPGLIELVSVDPSGGRSITLYEWTGRVGPRQAYPAVSPDGSAVALISADDELVMVSIDGLKKTKIFAKDRCHSPVWQPTGR
jgi:Tol biopolymer transport system component